MMWLPYFLLSDKCVEDRYATMTAVIDFLFLLFLFRMHHVGL